MPASENFMFVNQRAPRKPLSARQLQVGVVVAILLQFIIVGLFYFDVIHDPDHQKGTLHFHQGGDEQDYYALAQSLISGDLIQSKYTLGYPLFLVPWIVVFNPQEAQTLVPIIAAFNAFFLFPLAQISLTRLALRISHSRAIALMSVILWTCFPLILYAAMAAIGRASLGATWAVHFPWLQMLSDPPTVLLTLLSFLILFRVLDLPAGRTRLIYAALLGILCAVLLLLRINTILSSGIIILLLAVKRRWPELLIVGVLTFALFIPQLAYNARFFGNPLATGYQTLDQQPPNGLFSLVYPIKALTSKYGLAIGAGAECFGALVVAGVAVLCRRERIGAIAMGLWIAAYIVFFSLYYYSWTGSLTRFLLPMYPALAVMLSVLLLFRYTKPPQTDSNLRYSYPIAGES